MSKHSAGLLLFRRTPRGIEVLLAHPGGPFWKNKDVGAWTIPKGEVDPGEDSLDAARREFQEETGSVAAGPFIALGEVRQKSGKLVTAWAFEGDLHPSSVRSNTFEMEWPLRSGKKQKFLEIDRAEFYSLSEATQKINPAQRALLERLSEILSRGG